MIDALAFTDQREVAKLAEASRGVHRVVIDETHDLDAPPALNCSVTRSATRPLPTMSTRRFRRPSRRGGVWWANRIIGHGEDSHGTHDHERVGCRGLHQAGARSQTPSRQ